MANKIGANITESEDGSLLPGITGVIFGLVIAFLLTRIYKDIITGQLYMIVTIILYVVLGFFGGIIGGRSGAEILSNSIAKIQPPKKEKPTQDESEFAYNEKEKKNRRVPKILDTSAIIDGRILEIMRTGFLEGPIFLPMMANWTIMRICALLCMSATINCCRVRIRQSGLTTRIISLITS